MYLQANPDLTLLDFKNKTTDHKDAANFFRIFDRITLFLNGSPLPLGENLPPGEIESLAAKITAQRLYECLSPDNKNWAPELIEKFPEFKGKSYQKDYRRAFIRLIKHATAKGLLSLATRGVSPQWQEARNDLAVLLPYNAAKVNELTALGMTECFGFSLSKPYIFRRIIDSYNKMARYMTSIGILSPEEVLPEHIYGNDDSLYSKFKQEDRLNMTGYTHAKYGWNIYQQHYPEKNVTTWPTPMDGWEYRLKPEERPPLVEALVEEIEHSFDPSPSTVINIRQTIYAYLGYLKHYKDLDVDSLCENLSSPAELACLILAPLPLSEKGPDPDIDQDIQRLMGDPEYRDSLLSKAMLNIRRHRSATASRKNPFVMDFFQWNLQREKMGSAHKYISAFRIICDHLLQADSTQVEWLGKLLGECNKKRKNSPPAARKKRKRLLNLDPFLWGKLVLERKRLSEYAAKMRKPMDEKPGDCFREMNWAIAVRDELMFGFLLAFQLRTRNILEMKIGEDIIPDDYTIDIHEHRTKANKQIIRTFPEDGPFSDLKALLDVYLYEARPIILAGRKDTPYLFLTQAGKTEARDENDHLKPGAHSLAQVVEKLSVKRFKDLLPERLDRLSPHLFRDLFTNFAVYRGGGITIASQALTNDPSVAARYYLGKDLLVDDGLWSFVDKEMKEFGIDKQRKKKDHQQLRREIEAVVGKEEPRKVNRLLEILKKGG